MDRQTLAAPVTPPLLDARRIVRWEYLGRLAVGAAVFLAALVGWRDAPRESTLVVSVVVVVALVFTVASAAWSEIYKRPLGAAFRNIQIAFDLALVTAVVHVTGGADSQFAALYIPVIVSAALLLSLLGGVLAASLACALYLGDVILAHRAALDVGVWLQFAVFAAVALSSGYIAARLREAGAGHEQLAVELVKVRLQAEDILRNIRSGIVTVDGDGVLLFANPAASALLGLDLQAELGRPVLQRVREVAPALAEALRRAVRDGARTVRSEGLVHRNGRQVPIGLATTTTAVQGNGSSA
ncbi:MAG TPA: PAS domain-containing protein, partial [Gemmatimonadaceae bacterium]|nr:PAS domain-containing protein [Gemmatimonadaceae bacterium]